MAFNCKSNANWPPGNDTDFASVESDQILVSAVAYDVILNPYPWIVGGATITNDLRFSVLTNDEGNVLAGSL